MSHLLKAWSWLNGRKTLIGVIGLFMVGGLDAVGVLPADLSDALLKFFLSLSALGAGHKLYKRELV